MDRITKAQRSYNMSRIRSKNTAVEISFRKNLWNSGIRGYRVNAKIIGKPDLYFSKKKIAIFIDGCFWHKCPRCFIKPKTNLSYWTPKINKNALRDKKNNKDLKSEKIKVLRFWEHEIKNNMERCYNKFSKTYEKTN
jgi:DNA mismatch endonuclease (patch repair protein)